MKNTVKVALAAPKIRLCDPEYNANIYAESAKAADAAGADIIVFPELAISGATCGDLYMQEVLLKKSEAALKSYMQSVADLDIMSFIGLPVASGSEIYNAVAAVSYGELIGATASGEVKAPFSPVPYKGKKINLAGSRIDIARDLVYTDEKSGAEVFVKVGDDEAYSRDYVNLIINPMSMAEYVGLAERRRTYAAQVSEKLGLGFAICGAGEGESGTDGIYAAPRLVASSGRIVAEATLFDSDILYSEFELKPQKRNVKSESSYEEKMTRFPFIPEDDEEKAKACELALDIQARALASRAERAYAKKFVVGVSGGLDSTLAVLVAAKACDILSRSREDVIAITMPCFGTTERTKSNALSLASELGCTVRTIDIKAAVNQHFFDISHEIGNYNVVYENAQARERTQILMDIANAEGGMVIGTGDLSELALGFATYNGDHMSMYCVNGSVPKTLMRAMIAHFASEFEKEGNPELSRVLTDVINTPVSPELLPLEEGENRQHTEEIVGPYELHDFFLYHTVKFGKSPDKILLLACEIFDEYKREEIKGFLKIFVRRFITQQFKRSCMPDGPRVTEISLSPRASWHMPSDAAAKIWLETLEEM